jgi:hypothetical protein
MAKPFVGIIQDVQVPGDYIEFYAFKEPQRSRKAVYDDTTIRGRSEPHAFYSHTEAGVWNFQIDLTASVEQDDGGLYIGVQEKVSFIESFLMPDYGNVPGGLASVRPPHLCRIRILRMFDAIGTIRDVNTVYNSPYDVNTGMSGHVPTTFTFYEQREFGKAPLGYADIRRLTARGQNRFTGG